jgi:hypothetical protein
MRESLAQPWNAVTQRNARIFFGVLGSAAILISGCAAQKRPKIPWSTAVLVRPAAMQSPSLGEHAEVPVPDLGLDLEIPPPPAPLSAARPAPPRPRSIAPSSNQNAQPGKPEAPQIVPDFSAQESSTLQQQTSQSLSTAEHNLAAAAGKSLNATQFDLASKVRSFISDAREAGRAGDWARARDLAKKAQILSDELAASL